ncbi:MAG TPA: pseudouridine synthase [Vicinamibacterales bacterium]|nr:pseudouridine synthase [Vicinamibacterales bacterium]
MPPVRLQKILSHAGIASRRRAEDLILAGRVTINGHTVTTLGTRADPERDDIRVDGRRIAGSERRRYILLNKPRGCVTTRHDPQGRLTVLDLVNVREYVYPVGRLDYDSEGLLLLTNDGELAERLMHPRHEVERVYEAIVRGVPSPGALARLGRGVVLDGRRTAPAAVRLLGRLDAPGGPQARLQLTLREGRRHQVRRMCEAVGHPVLRLRRVRIGPIADARLAPGRWRELTPSEIAALRRAAGLEPASHDSARGEPAGARLRQRPRRTTG